ncbi:hypothetical protein BDV37DRAFT_50153 [Aspergillus pseudonomiae]|uniref:Uncharacterized protein n=1 Tax=Aspergillus pseudonomiae TaxID=1506151 RepID=A0A5N7CTY6_9EURO|nr:uncharacterized protein BDV37DRAFT_50153 [Aspergillus pseudonomiae]KAE8397666.1 hypothetical protein BDV37DRAFT_50153 [Aspergillus pseudonomiae]
MRTVRDAGPTYGFVISCRYYTQSHRNWLKMLLVAWLTQESRHTAPCFSLSQLGDTRTDSTE